MTEHEKKKGGFDPMTVKARVGSGYPEPFNLSAGEREKRALGDAVGLKNFGVNLVHLPPGAWSSQRHWHTKQDEFVYVLEGTLTLVMDAGRQTLTPGMTAGFPAGEGDGHHMIKEGPTPAVYLEIGDRTPNDFCEYPDIDLRLEPAGEDGTGYRYLHKDGTPYEGEK